MEEQAGLTSHTQLSDGSFARLGMSLQMYLRLVMQFHERTSSIKPPSLNKSRTFPRFFQTSTCTTTSRRHTYFRCLLNECPILPTGSAIKTLTKLSMQVSRMTLLEARASNSFDSTGLDKLEKLASSWEEEPTTFSPAILRACLDEFRTPLFTHLEEEV